MRSLQAVGKEILLDTPKSVYIFLGEEYGIKERYMNHLANYYGDVKEVENVQQFLNSMTTKRLVPLKPSLYVCRYDNSYVDSLDNSSSKKLDTAHIPGTFVMLYESSKQYSKIDKYLSDYCCMIESVDRKYIKKYLQDEFRLPDMLIEYAADIANNYGQARMICRSMMYGDVRELSSMTLKEFSEFFGIDKSPVEELFKLKIYSRNYKALLQLLDNFDGDFNNLYYLILSTLLELEKVISQNNKTSEIYKYAKFWKLEDIYNLFNHTYRELIRSRKISVDLRCSIMYIFSLLAYSTVPSVESVM